MREQLIQYVNLLFAGSQDQDEMKQEILQNTLDRYDDLISQGKSPEAAYRLAISGIGDIHEVLGNSTTQAEERVSPVITQKTDYRGRPLPSARQKTMRAVSIGMYICCVLPVIILGNIGNGVLGVCLMFLLIAAATVLMVMASDDEDEKTKEEKKRAEQRPIDKTLNTLALVLFLVLSFATGAWHITWLIWPIMAAVKGIIRACSDIKGGHDK